MIRRVVRVVDLFSQLVSITDGGEGRTKTKIYVLDTYDGHHKDSSEDR